MRPIRQREHVEFLPYLQAFPLLLLNPVLFLGPLLAAVIDEVIAEAFPGLDGSVAGGGWVSFFGFLLDSFGLAIAIIVADAIWRRGRASFDEAWDDAKRKGGDILMAAIGVNLVVNVVRYFGDVFNSETLATVLFLIAWIFVIYSLAAAAIGGSPGVASIQASIDLVRNGPINAVVLTIVSGLAYRLIGSALPAYLVLMVPASLLASLGTVTLVVAALFKALALSYIALIMAQRYNDVAFRR